MIRRRKPGVAVGRWVLALTAGTIAWTAASAKSDLSVGTGANYRVPITSWADMPFRTVIRQQHDFSCGSAAVATLLSYHFNRQTPEAPVFAAMWAAGDQPVIRRLGFSMLDIKRYLDGAGFKTEGYRLSLDQLRTVQRPGIIILDLHGYRHFVVVKGVDKDRILVGDPMLGIMRYAAADLARHWNGIFLTIVDTADHRPPRFNAAVDWQPRAGAPLHERDLGAPIAGLTNNLPPFYQITPLVSLDATSRIGK